jgi:hypothetical protein
MLDDIAEVSDDLLENSAMSDHSKDTTVIMCSVSCTFRQTLTKFLYSISCKKKKLWLSSGWKG